LRYCRWMPVMYPDHILEMMAILDPLKFTEATCAPVSIISAGASVTLFGSTFMSFTKLEQDKANAASMIKQNSLFMRITD